MGTPHLHGPANHHTITAGARQFAQGGDVDRSRRAHWVHFRLASGHGAREGAQLAVHLDTDGWREEIFLLTGRLQQGEPPLNLLPELCPRLYLVLGALHRRGLRGLEDEGEGLFIEVRSLEPGTYLDVVLCLVWPGPSWSLV